jgi:Rhodanese-like domain
MRKVLWSAAATGGLTLALALAACKAPDGAEAGRGAGANTASNTASNTAATPGPNVRQPVQAPHTEDVVRRVTPAEAQAMVERREAVIVDVRAKEQYDASHIKGSISIPRAQSAERASELPKDKLIIFYCA